MGSRKRNCLGALIAFALAAAPESGAQGTLTITRMATTKIIAMSTAVNITTLVHTGTTTNTVTAIPMGAATITRPVSTIPLMPPNSTSAPCPGFAARSRKS